MWISRHRATLRTLLAALLIWLPLSQAVALCCAEAGHGRDAHVTLAAATDACPDGHAATTRSGPAQPADAPAHDADCVAACLLLTAMTLPSTRAGLREPPPVRPAAPRNHQRVRPPHRTPILRPPALLPS